MLSGPNLADAIQKAIAEKRKIAGHEKYGPTALGKALGITQPSASELIKTGRLAKEKYLALVGAFADVVGPDHWGLPYTRTEMDLLSAFRDLPEATKIAVLDRLQLEAQRHRTQGAELAQGLLAPPSVSRKRTPRRAA